MKALLHDNQLFVGLFGAMLAGSVLFLLKAVPLKLYHWLIDAITITVTVSSRDQLFNWTLEWMARHSYTQTARRLRLDEGVGDHGDAGTGWRLAPGLGKHLIWDGRQPIFIERSEVKETAGSSAFASPETITLKTLGRSQERMRGVIRQIVGLRDRRDAVEIRVWQGWWMPLTSKAKRKMSTVYLPAKMKAKMIADFERFLKDAEFHADRGIPWRLGWLLKGLPGSGKTSIIKALASLFDRPIYYLNLSTVSDDNALLAAFTQAPARCIMLIEDADTAAATASREPVATKAVEPARIGELPAPAPAQEKKGITLSGMLNAIDGVASADGRLLVMTTNHPEKLDPALIRGGRIDTEWEFGTIAAPEVAEMVRTFYPGSNGLGDQVARWAESPVRTAADWQKLLMDNRDSTDGLLEALRSEEEKRC